ncbi:TPA: hypothetical protein ACX6SJ_003860 [Photobacterium damselae]
MDKLAFLIVALVVVEQPPPMLERFTTSSIQTLTQAPIATA